MNPTRQTLIQRLQAQPDERGWEEFAATYAGYLQAILRGMGLNHHDAEDLRQQVLLRIWKGLPNYHYEAGKHRFRSWLCTVARNAARNHLVSPAARQGDELPDDNPDPAPSELESIFTREWEEHLAQLALAEVRQRFQPQVMECFQLFMDGLAAPEVAARMGISVNAAYVNRQRVQNALVKEVVRLDQEIG